MAALVLLAGSLGTQMCFGVFLRPLSEEFDWTRAATSGAMSLSMGISGLIGIVMGRFTDKYKVRAVLTIGALVGTTAYLLLAVIDSLWQLYLCFGLGTGICVGCTYAPVNATISKWFVEKRALALGVALLGISLGQMVLSPVVNRIINAVGWRTGWVVLGVILFVSAAPAVILMGRAPAAGRGVAVEDAEPGSKDPGPLQGYSVRGAMKTRPFWMLMTTGSTVAAGLYIVVAHIVPCAQDLGVSSNTASLILTTTGVGNVAGTLLAWPLTVRLGNKHALTAVIAGEAVGMFLFMVTKSAWAFFLVSILFGFSLGAASPVRMAMVPPLFGLKSIGAMLGWATFAWSVGGIVGPYLAGYVYDVTKSYDIAFLTGGLLLLVGVLSVCFWGSHREKPDA